MRRRKNRHILLLFLASALLCGTSCKKAAPPPPSKAPEAPKSAASPAKPVQKAVSSVKSAITAPPVNPFDFSTKKDPFKPDIIVKVQPLTAGAKGGGTSTSSLPIHSFDVSQFVPIGIITTGKTNVAMVKDPNGKGYVLKPGMTIGKNDGKITAITATYIEVVEQFRDDNGKLHKETIKVVLPKKQ